MLLFLQSLKTSKFFPASGPLHLQYPQSGMQSLSLFSLSLNDLSGRPFLTSLLKEIIASIFCFCPSPLISCILIIICTYFVNLFAFLCIVDSILRVSSMRARNSCSGVMLTHKNVVAFGRDDVHNLLGTQ